MFTTGYSEYLCSRENEEGDFPLFRPEDEEAQEVGFTPDLFTGRIYRDDTYVTIAYIRSLYPRQGNVKKFYQNILDKGYQVRAVDCCTEMVKLCESLGFEYRYEFLPEYNAQKEYYLGKSPSSDVDIRSTDCC